MKSLKLLSFFLVCFFFNTSILSAQSGDRLTVEQKEELATQIEAYFQELDLSESQKTEFESIMKKSAEALKDLKESRLSRRNKYKKAKSIRAKKDREMKDLLSTDQYKVYEEKQKEMRKKMKDRRKNKK